VLRVSKLEIVEKGKNPVRPVIDAAQEGRVLATLLEESKENKKGAMKERLARKRVARVHQSNQRVLEE
tara:strand:- start:520 stop:723 length:204 start_codon:yes stop_codon:yes gene_type:complete